jgi:hypothetical protein
MKQLLLPALFLLPAVLWAEETVLKSPNGQLAVRIDNQGGQLHYQVSLNGSVALEKSRLGLVTDYADFSRNLSWLDVKTSRIDTVRKMTRTKAATSHYVANCADVTLRSANGYDMVLTFRVADNDVAYRYSLMRQNRDRYGNPKGCIILDECSSFRLPDSARAFISPQINPMTGWEKTKPSYEEDYLSEMPVAAKSQFGEGYIFPALFHNEHNWVLLGETGVDSHYCGSHLKDWTVDCGYQIAFPNDDEWRGKTSGKPGLNVPGTTPWRTVTVGETLKPIVETTIAYDLVNPRYEATTDYLPGRYTWSWLIWQDRSVNYDDQVRFIDLAASLGLEYCLVDNWWDQQIGRDRMEQLAAYARSKGVKLMLWYNSNGWWNDAPQTPRDCMNTAAARDREMAWLRSIGVAGIKVDFFGSDKQEAMSLYEDILTDANRYGLAVIFHGCTIPRGWEVMFPNYIASEACLASENVYFTEEHARSEAYELTMHPFVRNALGSFDWGGIILNKYMSRDNRSRHPRYTGDIFELASGVAIQTYVNCVALTPNAAEETPDFEKEFIRGMPTSWDEVRFLDGYPGRYVALARRSGDRWYIVAMNATDRVLELNLDMSSFGWNGSVRTCLRDLPAKKGERFMPAEKTTLKINKKGFTKIRLQPNGGTIIL